MLAWRRFVLTLVAAALGGCASYPLPQDTTGALTEGIVKHVRCETRKALRDSLIEIFHRRYGDVLVWRGFYGQALAEELHNNPLIFNELKVRDLHPAVRADFAYFEHSQIAYEFTLTMEESNIDGFDIGFARNFFKRQDALALKATADRQRKVARAFNIVDDFAELALQVNDVYCEPIPNLQVVYPLTGQLPIQDLVRSFVRTNAYDHLGGRKENIFGTYATPAVPNMADTIIFTTKFSGSANPTFTLNPTGSGLLLSSAGFKTDNFRSDMHQVIISVSTAPDMAKLRRVDASVAPPLMGGAQSLGFATVTPRGLPGYVASGRGAGNLTAERADFALRGIAEQRNRNVADAIIQAADSLSRLSR